MSVMGVAGMDVTAYRWASRSVEKEIVTSALPATILLMIGAIGAVVVGISTWATIELDDTDGADAPDKPEAVTVNVYDVPVVNGFN